ncbi:DNA segregation ATPase FtsK/SpoIIIE, S-DNA-T family [Prauserella marina]|uniref:DNA segregation ATPase FtsK/SpoIIIE, S-DNA-T family n=2 Tax=Prauserella marina TaxID=530584 RepID=A0A1G6W8L5_9PSEU|nr:S-DNA-T family DNA segregation ATPase FtsK/SpoIIIE [Prauserella marina]SDD62154.1 DNA segregation ATPase FtsK/SpoIIIE, S-DNA-T family [Prauserella marina]
MSGESYEERAAAESGRLPASPASANVEQVGPIYDGELVDEVPASTPAEPTLWQRFVSWWRLSPRVPVSLKSWPHARQAAKDMVVRVLRSPWRFVWAVLRGLVVAARAWRGWVKVVDYREAAEESGKLADKFENIRELTLFRWKISGSVLGAAVLAGIAVTVVYGAVALWGAGAVAAIALAITGRKKDGNPGRKPTLAGPRTLTWTIDSQVLVDAFRDAKLIGKDETLRLVERATRQGDGWAVTVDLPATRKAADVVKNRDALASALAVDELQLIVERVRGNGGHAGRVAMWVADKDPYAQPPLRTPLLDVARWDVWRAVPFGRDARDRKIALPLVWTSLLIGAIPRQGKTFAARLAASGLILDPHARLYVADFKAGKDWDAAARVAHRFLSGDEAEHVLALRDWLVELVGEVQRRYRRMRDLDDSVCPESKVTPGMSRDADLDMPVTALFIDEVQVALEDRTPISVQGKRLPVGEYIGELLTWLAKKAPAAGIILALATQRPDSKTIPSGLRAVLGSRFALRVMDWRDSNIVLGEQMNTRGFDSSRLLASHKGVGILRPDGETEAGADVLAMTVRTYFMPNDDWRTICERGRVLRESAGTLTGHSAGRDLPPLLDHASAAKVISASSGSTDELPEPLASVADYLADDLDGDGREFVPTDELRDALDVEPGQFAKDMGALGCRPTRQYIESEDGTRRVRGYVVADIRAAVERPRSGDIGPTGNAEGGLR